MQTLHFASIYYPYLGKLLDGRYESDDIELLWQYVTPPDKLFRQVIDSAAYDLSEMSLSAYTMLRGRGWTKYMALPIFTSRRFRHSAFYVKSDSEIVSGEQLAGKRVGLPEYHMSAAVWARGFLQEDYGVDLGSVEWHTGGPERPGRTERVELPARIKALIKPIAKDETLFNMLLDGRLDAVFSAHEPGIARESRARVRPLFPNCSEVEKDYYRRHRIFPIMHTLVLKEPYLGNGDGTAKKVHRILQGLKEEFYEKVAILKSSVVFPWIDDYITEITEMMGEDPFVHGIEPNARTLNKFLDYSTSQGLLDKRPRLEELFIDIDR